MSASGNYIVESDVDNWADAVSSTEEFATGAVAVDTNIIEVANDIDTGSLLRFSSTGELPAPLVTGTAYYAINEDSTHIKVATTPVNAAGDTAVDLTDQGSGTHTLDVGEGDSEDDRQETINRVEQLIEKITKDYFYAKDFAIYVNGNGDDRLFLGLVPDILSVTEVLLFAVELASDWYTHDTNSIYLDPESAGADDLAGLHYALKQTHKLFPKGMGNVKVTGTYGWIDGSCPPAIKRGAIILCRAENDPTLYPTHGRLKSEKLGDYSYTLSESSVRNTGIDEVDNLLKHYIRRKPMLSAI